MCARSCRLPPAHLRNGAGTTMGASVVRESRSRGKRKRTTGACGIFTGFYAVFCFAGRSFSLESAAEFAGWWCCRPQRRQEKRRPTMAKVLTKSQIIQAIADAHKDKLARKDVARVLESLANVGYKELKKNGLFVLPGFAKFVVIKKPATKERQGINPFTKEPMTFKAKPARKVLKARPVKAAKDAL